LLFPSPSAAWLAGPESPAKAAKFVGNAGNVNMRQSVLRLPMSFHSIHAADSWLPGVRGWHRMSYQGGQGGQRVCTFGRLAF
jgi:hypothetical protein